MKIIVAKRLRPFSHLPGTTVVIPCSLEAVVVYPTRLKFYDYSSTPPKLIDEIPLRITGPVSKFTVELNLEKGVVQVVGRGQEGYFRYFIYRSKEGNVSIKVEKSPGVLLESSKVTGEDFAPVNPFCQLSLGNNRQNDWEMIKRRADLKEILPLWHRFAQLMPSIAPATGPLVPLLEQESWVNLFHAAFGPMFAPRLSDEDFLGVAANSTELGGSPLYLIKEGGEKIQRAFFLADKTGIHLLPKVPLGLPSGRMVGAKIPGGEIDFEWRKNKIRRLVFRSESASSFKFILKPGLTSCRLKADGKIYDKNLNLNEPVNFEPGVIYALDRFT